MTWTLSAFADEAGSSTDEQVAALKRGNVRFIDPRNVDGQNITVLPIDDAKKVREKYDAAGVRVGMFGSPIGKIDIADDLKADLDKLEHLARLSEVFDCRAVRIFSYYNKKGADKAAWREEATARLKRLSDRSAQLGMVLYHENESGIYGDGPDEVIELAALRNDHFKLIYDFANYIRTGVDGWDCWQKCKPVTDAFHLKDQRKNGQHVPMGQAPETAAERILADAKASGFSGPATIEPHLTHSKAVVATHVSGSANQALADMPPAETFQVACTAAHDLLRKVGIDYR